MVYLKIQKISGSCIKIWSVDKSEYERSLA